MTYFRYFVLSAAVALLHICNIKCVESERCHAQRNQTTWYVIAIYSACYNKTNNITENHKLARALDKTVEHLWNLREIGFLGLWTLDNIKRKYLSIDVCNDFDRLPKLIESFNLDGYYHHDVWSRKSNATISLSSIIAIYAEGSDFMMDYLETSFSNDVR